MNSFQPPKRRALSESELYEVLAKLPSNQDGVQKAQVVLERQASLRAADNAAFEKWVSQMREIGTKEAADAVNLALGLVAVEEKSEITSPQEENTQLFTSPLSTIGQRKKRRQSQRTKFSLATTFVSWNSFAGIYAVVVWLLNFSLSDALVGLVLGLLISGFAKASLLTHKDSAIYRSAAAYGSRGYLFFALVAWLAILLWGGFYFQDLDQPSQLSGFIDQYFMQNIVWIVPLVVTSISAGLLGMLTNSRLIGVVLLVPVLIVLVFAISALQPFTGEIVLVAPTILGSLETTLLVAILSAAVTVLIKPHTQANTAEIVLGHSLAFLLTAGFLILLFSVVVFEGWPFLVLLAAVGIALALFSTTVCDYFGKKVGSALYFGLILLTAVALLTLEESALRPYLDAFLIAHLTVISFDSWLRSKPLHRPSIRTSFGFYGGWSTSSSFVIFTSVIAASPSVVNLLNGFGMEIDYFLASFLVAITLAFARLPLIRAQDREVAKVETGPKDLNNLLGL